MNEFVRIAQVSTSNISGGDGGNGPDPLLLALPQAGQSIVSARLPGQLVDFQQILNEDISFIRIGDDLQMIFASGGMSIVQGFFAGESGAEVAIVGNDQTLTIDQFISAATPQECG